MDDHLKIYVNLYCGEKIIKFFSGYYETRPMRGDLIQIEHILLGNIAVLRSIGWPEKDLNKMEEEDAELMKENDIDLTLDILQYAEVRKIMLGPWLGDDEDHYEMTIDAVIIPI